MNNQSPPCRACGSDDTTFVDLSSELYEGEAVECQACGSTVTMPHALAEAPAVPAPGDDG